MDRTKNWVGNLRVIDKDIRAQRILVDNGIERWWVDRDDPIFHAALQRQRAQGRPHIIEGPPSLSEATRQTFQRHLTAEECIEAVRRESCSQKSLFDSFTKLRHAHQGRPIGDHKPDEAPTRRPERTHREQALERDRFREKYAPPEDRPQRRGWFWPTVYVVITVSAAVATLWQVFG